MTKLDVIKKDLCRQIMEVTPEQLKDFVDMKDENFSTLE